MNTDPALSIAGGVVHAIWFGADFFDQTPDDGIRYCRSLDSGKTFSQPITIATFDTVTGPAVLTAAGSNVYIAYEAAGSPPRSYLRISTDGGTSWPETVRMDSTAPVVIEAIDNVLYYHYINRFTLKNGMKRSTNGGLDWDTTRFNSDMDPFNSMFVTRNLIHGVTSIDISNNKEVYYEFSDDFGKKWQRQYDPLSKDDFTISQLPKITGNGGRDLYVAWNDTGAIFMRHSADNGISWLPQIKVSEEHSAVFPDLSAQHEFVSIVWDNDVGGVRSTSLRPSNDRGFTFCPTEIPAADSSGGPAIKLYGNDVYLISSKEDAIASTIFFRHGRAIDNPNEADHPPSKSALYQNFPNPFNGTTHFKFDLTKATHVSLTVYDILGKRVRLVEDDDRPAGRYDIQYEMGDLASGVYFYQLQTSEFVERKSMLIIR